ncbi:hypothetical protein GE061_017070 [Apolygus lucorum]|uniref:Thaumatin-like protein n=1 Tax=Apolygus lucorum TaxID=248454 RepID=A0A8S9XHZ2_APOLU|nr:hypothetical protein GE061_017070 [Apolygus lucorum]
MRCIVYLAAFLATCSANDITLFNHCPFTVWPGFLGNPGKGQPENGGFELGAYQTKVVSVQGDWAGRVWGRTKCDASGHCETGDCGNRIECAGAGGVPPASLVEITFAGANGLDFYDVSLVDGYNLPLKMTPISGFSSRGQGKYDCGSAGCFADLNEICPAELAIKSGQWTVACQSACMKFNTDEYFSCAANDITLVNNCGYGVWPGIQGNPGKDTPENGGFALNAGDQKVVTVASNWAGRFWGRTGCDDSGHCETGDCGNKIECAGAGGNPPVTLAEITLAGANGLDYYDVSLVDGFNLPLTIQPVSGYKSNGGGQYDCTVAGCTNDLNPNCPSELAQQGADGNNDACQSACGAFNTDQYCCRNSYGTADTCKSSEWPVNYADYFKQNCPNAYSYAYDDSTSTFTCTGDPATNYQITFCP